MMGCDPCFGFLGALWQVVPVRMDIFFSWLCGEKVWSNGWRASGHVSFCMINWNKRHIILPLSVFETIN
jgi:hypothetical protein